MLFSPTTFAQLDPEHGAGITAACSPIVYTCDSDADCAGEAQDACEEGYCLPQNEWPGSARDNLRCTFTVTNTDDFRDSIEIKTTSTVKLDIFADGGTVTVSYPTARINGVAGTVTCASGNTALPCTLGDPTSAGGAGQVQFIVDTYFPTTADPSPLTTQATVTYFDNCDDVIDPDPGCFEGENTLQASPQQVSDLGCGTRPIDCDDGLACTTDSCDPALGCQNVPIVCDDGNACTDDYCDTATGDCVFGNPKVCDDGNACTEDYCDTATGDCVFGNPKVCDDSDVCTDDYCDTATGQCVFEDNGTCGEEICRTPGFWGARGGDEKGQNITLAVIGDGLEVCGQEISNTDLGNNESAIEAICINKGDPRAKLMRHLTSASLNCALGTCSPNTSDLLAVCNDICAVGTDVGAMNACGGALDCFNNGGHVLADGSCVPVGEGLCSETEAPCTTDSECPEFGSGEFCELWDSCHDRDLCPDATDGPIDGSDFCFEPPGPASSPKKCNEARKNTPYIFDLPDPTP
jgi:hypothetical protein